MEDGSPYLVAGLGNPDAEYAKTKHNAGFMVVDRLADRMDTSVRRRKFAGRTGEGRLEGRRVVLLKPMTYMNESGRSVAPAASYLDVPVERLVVVHDDIDLPLGRLRIKKGGGHGGHNGVRSLIRNLGDSEFTRLRVGIGRPDDGEVTDWVLSRFTHVEAERFAKLLDHAVDALEVILLEGVTAAMNRFNGPC